MNHNFKKWLLSGILFILAGAILLVIIALIGFSGASGFKRYLFIMAVSILTGYLVLKTITKIDPVNSPVLIFAVYSTIITSIIIFATKTVVRLDDAMKQLSVSAQGNPDIGGIGLTSMFGTINPISSAIVIFLGLNAAYGYYYYKQPEKDWKEFIPHLCGIIIMVAVYFLEIYLFYLMHRSSFS
jgi:hypothetical protein